MAHHSHVGNVHHMFKAADKMRTSVLISIPILVSSLIVKWLNGGTTGIVVGCVVQMLWQITVCSISSYQIVIKLWLTYHPRLRLLWLPNIPWNLNTSNHKHHCHSFTSIQCAVIPRNNLFVFSAIHPSVVAETFPGAACRGFSWVQDVSGPQYCM